MESRNEDSVLRKKVAEQVFRWLDISGADFMSPILYLLISRKALKPSWWQLFLMSSRSFMRLAETFYKKYVLDCMCSPFTKITYMLSCPMSLEEFLKVIWDAVFWAAILILPPVKLNWKRSHCGLFLSRSLLKSFLWYAPQPSGTSVLCFHTWVPLGLTVGSGCSLMAAR